MDTVAPAISHLFLHAPAREFQPPVVDEGRGAVRSSVELMSTGAEFAISRNRLTVSSNRSAPSRACDASASNSILAVKASTRVCSACRSAPEKPGLGA
jgi:hypothetical protein